MNSPKLKWYSKAYTDDNTTVNSTKKKSSVLFGDNIYFLTQQERGKLHQVITLELDKRLRECPLDLKDQRFIAIHSTHDQSFITLA